MVWRVPFGVNKHNLFNVFFEICFPVFADVKWFAGSHFWLWCDLRHTIAKTIIYINEILQQAQRQLEMLSQGGGRQRSNLAEGARNKELGTRAKLALIWHAFGPEAQRISKILNCGSESPIGDNKAVQSPNRDVTWRWGGWKYPIVIDDRQFHPRPRNEEGRWGEIQKLKFQTHPLE